MEPIASNGGEWLFIASLVVGCAGVAACVEAAIRVCFDAASRRRQTKVLLRDTPTSWADANRHALWCLRGQLLAGCVLISLYVVPRAIGMDLDPNDGVVAFDDRRKWLCHSRHWLLWLGLATLVSALTTQLWQWHQEVVEALADIVDAAADDAGQALLSPLNNDSPALVAKNNGGMAATTAGPGGTGTGAVLDGHLSHKLFQWYGIESTFHARVAKVMLGSQWPLIFLVVVFQFIWTAELQSFGVVSSTSTTTTASLAGGTQGRDVCHTELGNVGNILLLSTTFVYLSMGAWLVLAIRRLLQRARSLQLRFTMSIDWAFALSRASRSLFVIFGSYLVIFPTEIALTSATVYYGHAAFIAQSVFIAVVVATTIWWWRPPSEETVARRNDWLLVAPHDHQNAAFAAAVAVESAASNEIVAAETVKTLMVERSRVLTVNSRGGRDILGGAWEETAEDDQLTHPGGAVAGGGRGTDGAGTEDDIQRDEIIRSGLRYLSWHTEEMLAGVGATRAPHVGAIMVFGSAARQSMLQDGDADLHGGTDLPMPRITDRHHPHNHRSHHYHDDDHVVDVLKQVLEQRTSALNEALWANEAATAEVAAVRRHLAQFSSKLRLGDVQLAIQPQQLEKKDDAGRRSYEDDGIQDMSAVATTPLLPSVTAGAADETKMGKESNDSARDRQDRPDVQWALESDHSAEDNDDDEDEDDVLGEAFDSTDLRNLRGVRYATRSTMKTAEVERKGSDSHQAGGSSPRGSSGDKSTGSYGPRTLSTTYDDIRDLDGEGGDDNQESTAVAKNLVTAALKGDFKIGIQGLLKKRSRRQHQVSTYQKLLIILESISAFAVLVLTAMYSQTLVCTATLCPASDPGCSCDISCCANEGSAPILRVGGSNFCFPRNASTGTPVVQITDGQERQHLGGHLPSILASRSVLVSIMTILLQAIKSGWAFRISQKGERKDQARNSQTLSITTFCVDVIIFACWLPTMVAMNSFFIVHDDNLSGAAHSHGSGSFNATSDTYSPGDGESGWTLTATPQTCVESSNLPGNVKVQSLAGAAVEEGKADALPYATMYGMLITLGVACCLALLRSTVYILFHQQARRLGQWCCRQKEYEDDRGISLHGSGPGVNLSAGLDRCSNCGTTAMFTSYSCTFCGLTFCGDCFSTGRRSLPNRATVQVCEDCLSVPCPPFMINPVSGMANEFRRSYRRSIVAFTHSKNGGSLAQFIAKFHDDVAMAIDTGRLDDPAFVADKWIDDSNGEAGARLAASKYRMPKAIQENSVFAFFIRDLAASLGGFWDRQRAQLLPAAAHFFVSAGNLLNQAATPPAAAGGGKGSKMFASKLTERLTDLMGDDELNVIRKRFGQTKDALAKAEAGIVETKKRERKINELTQRFLLDLLSSKRMTAAMGQGWLNMVGAMMDADLTTKDDRLKAEGDCRMILAGASDRAQRDRHTAWGKLVLRLEECVMPHHRHQSIGLAVANVDPAALAAKSYSPLFVGNSYWWLAAPLPIRPPVLLADGGSLHDAELHKHRDLDPTTQQARSAAYQSLRGLTSEDRGAVLASMLGLDDTRGMFDASRAHFALNDGHLRQASRPGQFDRLPLAEVLVVPKLVASGLRAVFDKSSTNVSVIDSACIVVFDEALAIFSHVDAQAIELAKVKGKEAHGERGTVQRSGSRRFQRAQSKKVKREMISSIANIDQALDELPGRTLHDYRLAAFVPLVMIKNVRKRDWGLELRVFHDTLLSLHKESDGPGAGSLRVASRSGSSRSLSASSSPSDGGSSAGFWSEIYAHAMLHQLRVRVHRYESFAPVRHRNRARLITEGNEHMSLVADAMMAARDSIFIVDWWILPRIHLKRAAPGGSHPQEFRLDNLLLRKAQEGVHVYIMLYKHPPVPSLGSDRAVKEFERLHPNIHTLRHGPSLSKIFYSHHMKFVVVDHSIAFIGGVDLTPGRWDTEDHPLRDDRMPYTYPGIDFYDPQRGEIGANDFARVMTHPAGGGIDRTRTPRMPWHDISVCLSGEAAMDIGLNFVQRWFMHKGGLPSEDMSKPSLLPVARRSRDSGRSVSSGRQSKPGEASTTDSETKNGGSDKFAAAGEGAAGAGFPVWQFLGGFDDAKVQVLRSMANWSGNSRLECSIYHGYLDTIRNAKHFVYIENQFYVSELQGVKSVIQNRLSQVIYDRIAKAIRHHERFRVVIVTNAHPEGDIDGNTTKQIANYIYNSLCRGPDSLRGRLYENFGQDDVNRCLGLYCLQQSDTIRGRPVAHQVYIHAKLMIIDDRMAHIGSANINDRSFVGERDSELNVLIEDTHTVRGGGQNGAFGGSAARDGGHPGRNMRAFRMRLWNQHLGLACDDQSTVDPLSATSYDLWTKTAKHNSSVMLEHFPAMPHSHHTSRSQQKQDAVAKDHREWQHLNQHAAAGLDPSKPALRGHLADFPSGFLQEEGMTNKANDPVTFSQVQAMWI